MAQVVLFRGIVRTVLATRPTFYAEPALSQWAGNGGSNINNKLQQLLRKFGNSIPGAAEVVKEEVAALSAKKNTPTKPKGPATPKAKKRRVVKSEDNESQVEFSEEN
jgi:hypothetical protein